MWDRSGWRSVGLVCLLGLMGCESSRDEAADIELPDWLSEDAGIEGLDNGSSSLGAAASGEGVAAGGPAVPTAAPLETAHLELRLRQGDRFPLRKVVRQELTQAALSGTPSVSRSELSLLLAISVEEVQPGRTRLGVRYDHVGYSLDMPGHRVEFDSRNSQQPAPPEVQAYQAMVNDGFSFWIGADNQIAEVIGFKEFIERCVRGIPEQHRQQALLAIEADSGEKGIADFIDNTVGLLPYGAQKAAGDTWTRSQHIARPVPMEVNTVYTLMNLSAQEAEVHVDGTIMPSTTVSQVDGGGVRIIVKGGRTNGTCTIFRETGLPKESRVVRTVDMTVQMTGGIEFDQQKRTETVVSAFPASTPTAFVNQPGASSPQPAAHAVEAFPSAAGAATSAPPRD